MNDENIFYIVTEKQIYRSDAIIKQIDEWYWALHAGQIVPLRKANVDPLKSFEACIEIKQRIADKLVGIY